jgi:NitT/TauT family transport system permease protein
MTTAEGAREARQGWMPWLLGPLVLPALGAVVVVALTETANLDEWAVWQAALALGAAFAVPALLAAWAGRRGGVIEAVAWALACIGVQVALVFGVGFLALGLGPGS